MILAFFTNIPSHHQVPLGQAFSKLLGDEYTMVCWEAGSEERQKLGWPAHYEEKWLLKASTSKENFERANQLLRSADVVIWGYAPQNLIKERVKNNKLTFCYSERLFKQGRWRILDPRVFRGIQKRKLLNGNSHHALSVGPYCAKDYRFVGLFPNQMWRWGYFPAVPRVETDRIINRIPQILWAGRMLSWKRVDLLLSAAAWARAHSEKPFRIKIMGLGPEEEQLRLLSTHLGLADICEFRGPQTPEKIALLMDQSDIYVLPSDRNEGWGVVVNEAMSHGCCVIGSQDTGSAPYLIQDGVNGRIFNGANVENLGQILRWCIDNPDCRLEIGMAAKKTITELWAPTVAAERFLTLCEQISGQRPPIFTDNGPCSPA